MALERKRSGRRGRRPLLTAALAAAVLAGSAFDSRLIVRYYTCETSQLSAPVCLVLLADLHSCGYGEGQTGLIGRVRQLAPDAVLLAGDIVDDKLPEENAYTVVAALAGEFPCYYVTGNHEWWSGEAERICARMEGYGVTVLRGAGAELTLPSGDVLQLFGVDDPESGDSEAQLSRFQGTEEGFSILLAHRPEGIDEYRAYPFDLILSGHAHGGQWRLPGLVNGLYAPHQGLFPRYAGGRYDFGDTVFIVSRGLARESTPIPRLWNRPELVAVRLLPAESS